MRSRFAISYLAGSAAFVLSTFAAEGQTEPQPEAPETPPAEVEQKPKEPRIQQRSLPNPVADVVTLIQRQQLSGKSEAPIELLPGMIVVQYADPAFGFAWDPVECRLLLAWTGTDMKSGLRFVAEGPSPFATTLGAWGPPNYFGYRMVEGHPEFLYFFGRLGIEEKVLPAPDGDGFLQEWSVSQAEFGLQISVPERWKDSVKSDTGSWSGTVLSLPTAETVRSKLTWKFPSEPLLPELAAAWNPTPAPTRETEESGSEIEKKKE